MKSHVNPNFIVFAGGGIRALSYCGVIKNLSMRNIDGFAGSSSGSILAALLAYGYPIEHIKNVLFSANFAEMINTDVWQVSMLYGIASNYGYIDDSKFIAFLHSMIPEGTTFKNIDRELIIVGTNLNTRQPVYFSKETHPSMPIVTAIRISMSIPFTLPPVEYRNDLYVDGGISDNFPMEYVKGLGKKALGIYTKTTTKRYPVEGIADYMEALLSSSSQRTFNECDCLCVDIGTLEPHNFNISTQDKAKLYEAGLKTEVSV